MSEEYSKIIKLRCIICGDDSSFEYNDDKSYIKCKKCNREYFGGYEELVELNNALINKNVNEVQEQMQAEIADRIKSMFDKLNL